jgi:hypothetical protein
MLSERWYSGPKDMARGGKYSSHEKTGGGGFDYCTVAEFQIKIMLESS